MTSEPLCYSYRARFFPPRYRFQGLPLPLSKLDVIRTKSTYETFLCQLRFLIEIVGHVNVTFKTKSGCKGQANVAPHRGKANNCHLNKINPAHNKGTLARFDKRK